MQLLWKPPTSLTLRIAAIICETAPDYVVFMYDIDVTRAMYHRWHNYRKL